jgi:hypothetical protein
MVAEAGHFFISVVGISVVGDILMFNRVYSISERQNLGNSFSRGVVVAAGIYKRPPMMSLHG